MTATTQALPAPTPASLPPRRTWIPREVTSRQVLGTITVVIESDLVCLADDTRPDDTQVLRTEPGSSPRVTALDAIIERANSILEGRNELVRVVVSDPRLREVLNQATMHALDNLIIESGVPVETREQFKAAVDRLGAAPMVVATDASRSRAAQRSGIAAVTQDGRWITRLVNSLDICHAEVEAICMAVTHFRAVRPVVVVSDSQPAVNMVSGYLQTGVLPESALRNAKMAKAMRAIAEVAAERAIRVEWVRGHNGDPLNEAADRLAVLTRRSAGIGGQVTKQIARNIIDDLLEELKESDRPVIESYQNAA